MWTHLSTAHLSTVVLTEMSCGLENPAASLHRTDEYLFPRVTEIEVAFLDAAADCVNGQQFSEVLLSPCGYI